MCQGPGSTAGNRSSGTEAKPALLGSVPHGGDLLWQSGDPHGDKHPPPCRGSRDPYSRAQNRNNKGAREQRRAPGPFPPLLPCCEREVGEAPPLPRAGCSSKTSPVPPQDGAPAGTKYSNIALASFSQLGSKLRQSEPSEPSLCLHEGVCLHRLRLAQTPAPLQSPEHELGCKAKGEQGHGQQSQDEPRGRAVCEPAALPPCQPRHRASRAVSICGRGSSLHGPKGSSRQLPGAGSTSSPGKQPSVCLGAGQAQQNPQRSVTIA